MPYHINGRMFLAPDAADYTVVEWEPASNPNHIVHTQIICIGTCSLSGQ